MPKARLSWIDHLRTLVIILVVSIHASVTYSHIGGWYVNSDQPPGKVATFFFLLWETHLQSFFMGFMFFFAGYFSWGSRKRKGAGGFVRDRLVRLGIPTLLFMLVIQPFIVIVIHPWAGPRPQWPGWYVHFIRSGEFIGRSGPMWFAFALLIFSILWAGWTRIRRDSPVSEEGEPSAPSGVRLLVFALGLGLASFLVRLVQPMGTDVLNMQLCFFAQYVAAFAVGLAAARHGWLGALAGSSQAKRAGWMALVGGPTVLTLLIYLGSSGGLLSFAGGLHWQAAGYAFWEQATGVGLSLGLMYLFNWSLNREGPVLRFLADRSFGIYFIHTPILVALYLLMRPLDWPAWPMALLMTAAGWTLALGAADLLKRVPGLGRLF